MRRAKGLGPVWRRATLLLAAGCTLAAAGGAAEQPANRRGGGSGSGSAQQPAVPPPSSPLDALIRRDRPRDWTLKVNINVRSVKERDGNGMPVFQPIDLRTAAVVFPVNFSTAGSELDEKNFKGVLKFDGKVADESPVFQDGYAAGTRLARWKLENVNGREVELELELPMTCWRTIFDEKAAEAIPWPGSWSPAAASALKADTYVDFDNPEKEIIRNLVRTWTEGRDPKKLPPVTLAKYLAGKVLEHAQPSGDGLRFTRNSMLMGVDLLPATQTALDGRGSEHDIAVLLTAVYRAAGLPARTVTGLDVGGKKDSDRFLDSRRGGKTKLRSWVEFCLYDEKASKELWVPVDIVRLRGSSSRAPALNRPWKYFGAIDDLDMVIPFAFQFHPPTTVVAHGAVGFWGWLTTPEIPQVEQHLRFDAQTTPRRSGDRQRER